MIWLAIIAYALFGGWVYRIRGGMPPSLFGCGKFCDRNLYAAGLVLPLWFLAPWYVAAIAQVLAFGALTTAHGDSQDFGHAGRTDPSEWYNVILHRVMRAQDGYLHDFCGMFLSGGLYSLPTALALSWYATPLWLLLIPVLALGKALAYLIGWAVYDQWGPLWRDIPGLRHVGPGTGMGEALTGVFQWGTVAVLWAVV